ncbi:MAG: PKD domain-containing protein [Bacteroidales bacterium]
MKRLSTILLPFIFILAFIFTACEEDDTALHGLTAEAGTDREVSVGQTVELNSGASTDMNGEGFNSNWSFVSRPAGSSSTINNADSELATFVPDVAGDYLVNLTISNGLGESSDEVLLTAINAGTQDIGGTYSEELHLINLVENPDVPDYIVTSGLTMTARLRIDPGVRIDVTSDVLIRIRNDGFLEANGTATEPIVIKGTSNVTGSWRGIWSESSDFDNVLNHVQISGAGSNNITSGAPRAAVFVSGNRLSFNHCTFSDINGYGISVNNTGVQIPLENCFFSDNQQGAMRITADQIKYIDSETNFNNHEIVITGTNLSSDSDHTWPAAQNGSYLFSSSLSVYDNVTIEAGAVLLFDNDVLIRFRGTNGKYQALGSLEKPIVFKGSVEQAGAWRGITIESSNIENLFQHVQFFHAGHSDLLSGYGKAAVGFSSDARGTFSNVYLNDIDGYGMYIRYDGTQISFADLGFGQNISQGALHIHAAQIAYLDNQSNFAGNYVVVNGGQISEDQDVEWPFLLSGSYLFINTTNIYGKVNIQPGAILEFDNDILMRVRNNGVLAANGTASGNILFTRKNGSTDYWKGIVIESSSVENSMDYVEISYAGNSNLISGFGKTNLGLSSSARLNLSNSTISNSLGYGIWLRSGADFTQSNNTFINNAEGDIYEP